MLLRFGGVHGFRFAASAEYVGDASNHTRCSQPQMLTAIEGGISGHEFSARTMA